MDESAIRTTELAEKCRKELDNLETLGKKLQDTLDALGVSDEVEQSNEEELEDHGGELEYIDEAQIAVKTEEGKKSPGLSDPD